MSNIYEEQVTNNIKNSNNNIKKLKKDFPECFDKNGDFDFEKFKKELQTSEINFSKESYGLDWLGKSYARVLASDEATTLLTEDEVIFVSIDDNEVSQLKLLMDEIFGEENFEALINWRRRHNQPNDKTKMIAKVSEHILVFSKNSDTLKQKKTFYTLPLSEERKKSYKNPDNDSRGIWDTTPWKTSTNQGGSIYKIKTPTGVKYEEEWMGSEETFQNLLKDNKIIFSDNGNGLPRKKVFWSDRLKNGQPAHNFWIHKEFGSNQDGSAEVDNLLGKGIFDKPKPTKLLKIILKLSTQNNDPSSTSLQEVEQQVML